MTTGVIKSQGTRLFFAYPAAESSSDPDGITILKVACATGISGLGGARSQIDVTCLESEEMEYEAGLANPGQVSVPINFIPRSEAHQALMALKESGTLISWMIVASDQAGSPSAVDSEDRLVSPGSTTVEFLAYVADVNLDFATNDISKGTITLQRSGAPVFDWPTADLP